MLHIAPGASGPASRWANAAQHGDELLILGPRRDRGDWGGIEFRPGDARTVLLAGDETAAPAIARILEDAGRELRGVAFIEVPEGGDILPISAPDGVEVRWLARGARAHGEALIPAVLEYLGGVPAEVSIVDVDTEDPLWETPQFSGLGEEVVECGEPRRPLLLDRGRKWRGHNPSPPPREGPRHRPRTGRVHGLLAARGRDARIAGAAALSEASISRRGGRVTATMAK